MNLQNVVHTAAGARRRAHKAPASDPPLVFGHDFYGPTGVKFCPHVLASWIGMMPGTFLYVYIGTAGKAVVAAAAGAEAVQHG
jgi:hypothetical protein